MYICTVHVCLNYYYNNIMTDDQETLFIYMYLCIQSCEIHPLTTTCTCV